MILKLRSVRELRMRLAELTLANTEKELATSLHTEEAARQELVSVSERSAAETVQANQALLQRRSGRLGISKWLADRKRSESAVQAARAKVDDAASDRKGSELECSTARTHWRAVRVDVERLRLLTERLEDEAR